MTDLGNLTAGVFAFITFLIIGRLLVPMSVTHAKTARFQLKLFTIALFLRFGLSVALYNFNLVAVVGDDDASGWGYGAWLHYTWVSAGYGFPDVFMAWSGAFKLGNPEFGFSTHPGYYYLVGTLFYTIGFASRLVAATMNGFLGAMTVVFTYRTARCLFSEAAAVRVGWWTCLFPSMIIWSAQTVKEPVVILLEVVALYACIQLKRSGFAMRHVLLCGLAVAAVTPFRFYAAYIGAAAVATVLLVPVVGSSFKRSSTLGFLMFVATLGVVAILLSRTETRVSSFDVDFIQKFRKDLSEASGSGVKMDFDMQTPTGFSAATLVGAAYLLLAPFPWQLGGASLRMMLTLPELVYWWWLVFYGAIPGARYLCRHRFNDIAPMLVFVIGLGLLYSMTFANIGLVFRQRAQLLPWLFMFAAVGLERRLAATRPRRTVQYPSAPVRTQPSLAQPLSHG